MKTRNSALAAALCAAAAIAAGCRREALRAAAAPTPRAIPAPTARALLGYLDESAEVPPKSGGTLKRRLSGDPATLNAVLQSGAPEQEVLQYVSRNLLDFDSRMRLVPGLAESWSVSADGRSYTFRIRSDAVWQDGSAVTADDAVFTIRAIVDPKVASPVYKPVFDRLESVERTGDREFVARFREPYAYQAMAFVLPLLPERRFAGKPLTRSPDNRAPFSNGPYRFVSWKSQREIVLEKNPKAWVLRPASIESSFGSCPRTPSRTVS